MAAGITSKLQYLKDIGVGAIWLSPFYKSPQADFGYDISDFLDVDPTYGTLADFKDMVDTAHALGEAVFFRIFSQGLEDTLRRLSNNVPESSPIFQV